MTIPTFPVLPGVTYPVRRTVAFNTAREESVSGKTARYPIQSRPRWKWSLDMDMLRQQFHGVSGELSTLYGFFASLYGGAYPFFYLDADDNTVTNQSFGAGDGATLAFQLVRTLGGFSEPVFGSVGASIVSGVLSGAPSIYVAGVLKTPVTDYNISATGLVTFVAAPAVGAALTWTGVYTWLCEMDTDQLETVLELHGLYSARQIQFSSKLL